MRELSFYILTYNSQKYLGKILERVRSVSDEIIVLDSGSTDSTREISEEYTDKFYVRSFDNFTNQRKYALGKCSFDWVFSLDSDEIPDEKFMASVARLKEEDFGESSGIDSYRISRIWHVMNKKVRAFYPITSPDAPIRLFRKDKVDFRSSTFVHETICGFDRTEIIWEGRVDHYTFENREEFEEKMERYTTLAAIDARKRGKRGSVCNAFIHAVGAFLKWYIRKGGFKDGMIGLINGKYAYHYTWQKYIKLMHLADRSGMSGEPEG
jgi:glycosyltransferase involved in cell wall biosynthesis